MDPSVPQQQAPTEARHTKKRGNLITWTRDARSSGFQQGQTEPRIMMSRTQPLSGRALVTSLVRSMTASEPFSSVNLLSTSW